MRYVSTQVGRLSVVLDSSGKVLVRKLDQRGNDVVIGVAKWSGNATTDRLQSKTTIPDKGDWRKVDEALVAELAASANLPMTSRLDPGELPAGEPVVKFGEVPADASKADVKWPVGGLIIFGLIAAVLGVGLYFAWPYIKWAGDKLPDRDRGDANGTTCKRDRDCRSGVCDYGTCKVSKRSRGDRCDFNSQCSSGDCTRGLCN